MPRLLSELAVEAMPVPSKMVGKLVLRDSDAVVTHVKG